MNDAKVGWQNGPSERGTLTILWSCLSTVIACTWTILHLNIPSRLDGALTKTIRKAKWMIITVLFPEFIFSKAVCELQMAIDDLYTIGLKDGLTWDAPFGRGLRFLRRVLHYSPKRQEKKRKRKRHSRPPERKVAISPTTNTRNPQIPEERVWTLTHSYFANMGGFERYHASGFPIPLTAHALANCCIGTDHDPLPDLSLRKEDIEDKSKADWLVKTIAIAQISWLILSVIVRGVTHIPITQLEICTTAFGLLAIATWAANWSKPKDIGTPVRFKVLLDTYTCEAYKYYGEPFFRRLYMPSESGKADTNGARSPRIANDFVRLEGSIPPMAIMMAISTAIFGGLHCLAWNFAFPTKTELVIWMIASVLSATIPTAALIANIVVVGRINIAIKNCSKACRNLARVPRDSRPKAPTELKAGEAVGDANYSDLAKELRIFHSNLTSFIRWRLHHDKMFNSFEAARRAYLHAPEARKNLREELEDMGIQQPDFFLSLIRHPGLIRGEKERLEKILIPCDRASRFITIMGGIFYAIVRIVILALAFAALRFAPEGAYIASWTRLLPNIS